jgi:hypothetical protein
MGHVTVVSPGHIKIVDRDQDTEPTLAELQEWVGGYIELVHLEDEEGRFQIVVNEEGLLHGMEVNHWATNLRNRSGGIQGGPVQQVPLVGTVVVLRGNAVLT